MNPRIVAVMVGMGVVIGLLAGLLIGAVLFRPGAQPSAQVLATPTLAPEVKAVALPNAEAEPVLPRPDGKPLLELADRICQGDTKAVIELIDATSKLYRGVNFQRDTRRVQDNFVVMTAAFQRIGEAAGQSSAPAMAALKQCAASGTHTSGFATNALGTAAAAGNTEALNMLLHYDQFGILLSSAVGALRQSAAKGNAEAIAFLVSVLDDPQAQPLWTMASQELRVPAAQGNTVAAEALDRYDAQAEQRR